MGRSKAREFTLRGLADASGTPARTLRYYIARDLLPPPLRAGRNAAYGEAHLRQLERIRQAQSQGESLAAIQQQLAGGAAAIPAAESWWRYPLGGGAVVAWVRADVSPWRLRAVQRWLAQFPESEEEK